MQRHVVVIGGGFGGLWAVRALANAPVDITLIDRSNHHLFQPLLYEVATAGLAAPSIAAPLRHILRRQRNVTVRLGEVERIDTVERIVSVGGDSLRYDDLIVASGATHAYFGQDAWSAHAPGLKTLNDALHIRSRVLRAFEQAEIARDPAERDAWLTFVIVGAGPTGVELAGTLAEIAQHTLADEFRHIDPRRARVLLVEAGPRVLAAFRESLSSKALRQLVALGVDVRLESPVKEIGAGYVDLPAGRLAAKTVVWAAGVAASPLGQFLGAPLDRAGRVPVDQHLNVAGHPEIFVVGDLASVESGGAKVPGVAPAAKQMGAHAASVIRARLAGRTPTPFRYRDFGALATIGRKSAVVQIGKFELSGVLAWLFWLFAHVLFLIGFRNRLIVMIDWAWAYFTYKRSARVIVAERADAS
jgi:NADH:ubiquinone reductase (H+-translocating)